MMCPVQKRKGRWSFQNGTPVTGFQASLVNYQKD